LFAKSDTRPQGPPSRRNSREVSPPLRYHCFFVLSCFDKLRKWEPVFYYKFSYHYLGRGGLRSFNNCHNCDFAMHRNRSRNGKL
jgi:hypothetical protein